MTVAEFRLPDVGEGLTEAEVVAWRVAVGDTVSRNDIVVEIETAKSVVELPSPFDGVVTALFAEPGDTVTVGTPLIAFGTDQAGDRSATAAATTAMPLTAAADEGVNVVTTGSPALLVGSGPLAERLGGTRRRVSPVGHGHPEVPDRGRHGRPLAAPPVRIAARRGGVDLREVRGTGPHGTVTRADLDRYLVDRGQAGHGLGADSRTERASVPSPGRAGDRVVEPASAVRRATARAMAASAFTAPHATVFLAADVTESVGLLARLRAHPALAGRKVTPLLLVARALLGAVRAFPDINARWLDGDQAIERFEHVGLGIAASTPRGLVVPCIHMADTLTLPALAAALEDLTTTARQGRTRPEAMTGGTITITNIGPFGIDTATPILNPGEAAILCAGTITKRPWVHDGQVVPRDVMQLSLSCDHRLVDGELAGRVLAHVGQVLTDPSTELALA